MTSQPNHPRRPRFKRRAFDEPKKESGAFNALVQHQSRRDHSVHELKTKLGKRYTPEAVQEALLRAQELRFLSNESEMAERLVEEYHRKHKGRQAIEFELKKRLLPIVIWSDETELIKARLLIEKQFGQDGKLDYSTKQRAYRFLRNRGFEDFIVKKVLYEKS